MNLIPFLIGLISAPAAIVYTPESILTNPPDRALYIGARRRYATCTDVRWSPDGTMISSIGLLSPTLYTYRFVDGSAILTSFVSNLDLVDPEKLAYSPDGSSLAVSSRGAVQIYTIEAGSAVPRAAMRIGEEGDGIVHDAAFSSDGTYLVYVTIDHPGKIRLYKKGEGTYRLIQTIVNAVAPLKPKSAVFTPNQKYLIIGYSVNAQKTDALPSSYMAVYPFDPLKGEITPHPIGESRWVGWLEALVLSRDSRSIFSTDQAFDRVIFHPFDPEMGKLGGASTLLQNPEAQLSFPHGIAISPDGQFLAVSNYGTDTFNLYRLEGE